MKSKISGFIICKNIREIKYFKRQALKKEPMFNVQNITYKQQENDIHQRNMQKLSHTLHLSRIVLQVPDIEKVKILARMMRSLTDETLKN